MNKNNRIYKIIYFLMDYDKFITSKELAGKLNVTERTVKSDISSVEEIIKNNGLELISKQGKGYKLIVEDPNKMNSLKSNLIYNLQVYPALTSERVFKVIQILEIIINAKKGITFEYICERLYASKNSLYEEFKQAKKVIRDFKLNLSSKKTGIALQGNELNIRLLMLKVYIFRQQSLYDYFIGEINFTNNEVEQKFVRDLILKYLREDEESINDGMINCIAMYILISLHRINKGFSVVLSEDEVNLATKLPHLRLAKKIYGDLQLDIKDENEILSLAILLSMEAEISSIDLYSRNYSFIKDEIESFMALLCKSIHNKYDIDISSSRYIDVLRQSSVSLFVKLHLGLTNVDFYFYDGEDKIYTMPFARIFANFYEEVFYSKYNVGFSNGEYWKCVCAFERIISLIEYPYNKPKVCVCSVRGYADAYITESYINRYFCSYFEILDVKQLYELRTINKDSYDWLILNGEEFVYKYDWKYLVVNRIPNQHDLINIYKYIFYSGVKNDGVINKLFNLDFNLYTNYEIDSLSNFFNYLHYRFLHFESSEIYAKRMYFTTLIGKTLFICIKSNNLNGIEIYELNKEVNYNGQILDSIIIIDIKLGNNLILFKLINDLLYYLTEKQYRKVFDRIVKNKNKDDFDEFVKSIFLH